MTSSAAHFGLGSEFDNFLFAPVAEDRSGIEVSVVSLLGRLNLDPWQTAAGLARLPVDMAAVNLTALIGRVPGLVPQAADRRTVAIRLLALLPRHEKVPTGASRPLGAVHGSTSRQPVTTRVLLTVYLGIVLTSQLVLAYLETTEHTDMHAPSSSTVPSRTLQAPPSVK